MVLTQCSQVPKQVVGKILAKGDEDPLAELMAMPTCEPKKRYKVKKQACVTTTKSFFRAEAFAIMKVSGLLPGFLSGGAGGLPWIWLAPPLDMLRILFYML